MLGVQLIQQMEIFYGTGGAEIKAKMLASGEPYLPSVSKNFERFNILRPFNGMDFYRQSRERDSYRTIFLEDWQKTKLSTLSGKPMDLLICAAAPSLSFPHNVLIWKGYTSLFNLLDYPSLIVPLGKFKLDPAKDVKDESYKPSNIWDRDVYNLYDPQTYKDMPMCIQVVGKQLHDEELIAFGKVVDRVIN